MKDCAPPSGTVSHRPRPSHAVPRRPPPSSALFRCFPLCSAVPRCPLPSPTTPGRPPPSPTVPYLIMSQIVGLVVLPNDGRPGNSRTRMDYVLPSRPVLGAWQSPRGALWGPGRVRTLIIVVRIPSLYGIQIFPRYHKRSSFHRHRPNPIPFFSFSPLSKFFFMAWILLSTLLASCIFPSSTSWGSVVSGMARLMLSVSEMYQYGSFGSKIPTFLVSLLSAAFGTSGKCRRVVHGGPEPSWSTKGGRGPHGPPGPLRSALIHTFSKFTQNVDQGGSGWTRRTRGTITPLGGPGVVFTFC